MRKLLVLLALSVVLSAQNIPVPCKTQAQLLEEKSIDLDTKTLKGWVRVLNNKSKQGLYGITLTREETLALIRCITQELNNRKELGKMK